MKLVSMTEPGVRWDENGGDAITKTVARHDLPEKVGRRADDGVENKLEDGHPVDNKRRLRKVSALRAIFIEAHLPGDAHTSWRYAVRAWARRFDVAASTADWKVALTIGGAMVRAARDL